MTTIKIQHPNPEALNQILTGILNIACVAAQRGHIPNNLEMDCPQQFGRYWWREGDKFHLASAHNDFWAFVQDEMPGFICLRFQYRYDREFAFNRTMAELAKILFRNEVQIIENYIPERLKEAVL